MNELGALVALMMPGADAKRPHPGLPLRKTVMDGFYARQPSVYMFTSKRLHGLSSMTQITDVLDAPAKAGDCDGDGRVHIIAVRVTHDRFDVFPSTSGSFKEEPEWASQQGGYSSEVSVRPVLLASSYDAPRICLVPTVAVRPLREHPRH